MDSCNANHWERPEHLLNKAIKFYIRLERNLTFDSYRIYRNQLQSMIQQKKEKALTIKENIAKYDDIFSIHWNILQEMKG